ncbi:Methyltransferase [Spironucleus salmonicida]|uniref:Methyltransferase n=1 Tax=Spironucleus salmonicida TaxID=348837 RepID=V6LKS4_9EUKA|nr:Methyltransferase [Spironucleus salmonicida]|eukprot:EST44968.1 Methyltransferase [Spironucleus salmonicida]
MDIRNSNKLKTKVAPAIKKSTPTSIQNPIDLENEHVHKVYESIASHFSNTRNRPWPLVSNFIKQHPFSFILDAGCGNGKYLQHQNQFNFAFDYSHNLAKIALNKPAEIVVGDTLRIPFQSNKFDIIISIAVIHHLASTDRRVEALKEINRCLTVGGRALVCAWAVEQGVSGTDMLVPWTQQLQNKLHFTDDTDVANDKIKGQEIKKQGRFYHFFLNGELSEMGKSAGLQIDQKMGQQLYEEIYGQTEMQDEYYDHDNWYCIFYKK